MSNENISSDDVSAMRREGDFKSFLRQAIKTGQRTHRENLRPAAPSLPAAPGHIPGAWPIGPSDAEANDRTTCTCTGCRSYAKGQPQQSHPNA